MAVISTIDNSKTDMSLRPDDCQKIISNVKVGDIRMEALGRSQYPGQRLPRGVMPGLKSIGFIDSNRQRHWETGWHYNEGIEICYLENGHIDFFTEKGAYHLQPDDVSIMGPWQRHCHGDTNSLPGRLFWMIVDFRTRQPEQAWSWPKWIVLNQNDREEFFHRLKNLHNPVFSGESDLRRCIRRIGKLIAQGEYESGWSLLAVLINEAFALLLDQLRHQGDPHHESDRASLQLVGQFWQDLVNSSQQLTRKWTLPALAKECGFGVTQFVKHTQALVNATPMQYLRQCRLQAAAGLLLDNPRDTVTEIAQKCGFSSGQHFATTFRQHFSCSPQTYRYMQ